MKWRLHFQFGLFSPKAPQRCPHSHPSEQNCIGVALQTLLLFASTRCQAAAVGDALLNSSLLYSPFSKSLPFSYSFFVLKIYHPRGSQNQPQKMTILWMLKLVYLSLGLFRAEIRRWCKCASSTDDETHAYYLFLKYIYSYQLFQFLSPNSPKSLSVPVLQLGSLGSVFTGGSGGGGGGRLCIWLLHRHQLQYFNSSFSPCSLPLPPAPGTWLPGWLSKEKNVLSELDRFQAGSIWQGLSYMFLGSLSCSHLIKMAVTTCKWSSPHRF